MEFIFAILDTRYVRRIVLRCPEFTKLRPSMNTYFFIRLVDSTSRNLDKKCPCFLAFHSTMNRVAFGVGADEFHERFSLVEQIGVGGGFKYPFASSRSSSAERLLRSRFCEGAQRCRQAYKGSRGCEGKGFPNMLPMLFSRVITRCIDP